MEGYGREKAVVRCQAALPEPNADYCGAEAEYEIQSTFLDSSVYRCSEHVNSGVHAARLLFGSSNVGVYQQTSIMVERWGWRLLTHWPLLPDMRRCGFVSRAGDQCMLIAHEDDVAHVTSAKAQELSS